MITEGTTYKERHLSTNKKIIKVAVESWGQVIQYS